MGNYSKCHIGKTFNNTNIIVVDGGDKVGNVKVKCLVCSKDPELFGDGMFEVKFSGLIRGQLPCGCSKKHLWSLEQYEIKITRKINSQNLPIRFLGFGTISAIISSTEVRLFCIKNNEEYTISSISNFFQGKGNYGKVYTVDEMISKYNLSNPNYTVWDSGKKSGRNAVCGFHCKICEASGYESVFEIKSNHLYSGTIPCYCSVKKSISGDHIVEKTKRKIYEEELIDISVIGAYYNKGYWYSVMLCGTHGMYSRIYGGIDKYGCHCIKCNPAKTGYDISKQGYIYLLDIEILTGIVLGYGITNKLNNRLTTHRKNLNNLDYKILSTRVFEGSGTKVLSVENAIKSLHKTGLIDCEGFRRESISIDRKEEVLELCAGLKEIVYKVNDNP